jgi:hypothetical protein
MRLSSFVRACSLFAGLTGLTAGCTPYANPYAAQAKQAQLNMATYHDPRFDKSSADLDALVAEQTKDYTPDGLPQAGKLEAFRPHPMPLKRGKCYTIVLRLDPGATFSDHAKKGISFLYTGVDGFHGVNGGPGIVGPGGVGSAGCPQADAESARFELQAYFGSAMDKSRVHELGTGGYTLQLYSKPISDERLTAIKADMNRQVQEQREFAAQERAREDMRALRGCAICERKFNNCIADWRRGASRSMCESDFRSCTFHEAGIQGSRQCAH